MKSSRLHPIVRQSQGLALSQILVTITIIGILAAIGVPSWLGLIANQRMRAASTNALSALRLAQSGARRENLRWTLRFRTNDGRVQWTAYRSTDSADTWVWNDLMEDANLVEINPTNTNLNLNDGTYMLTFEFNGQVLNGTSLPKRITFRPVNNASADTQRCLRIQTILGATSLDRGAACNS